MRNLTEIIESSWKDRSKLANPEVIEAVEEVIELLDKGKLRVAQQLDRCRW